MIETFVILLQTTVNMARFLDDQSREAYTLNGAYTVSTRSVNRYGHETILFLEDGNGPKQIVLGDLGISIPDKEMVLEALKAGRGRAV